MADMTEPYDALTPGHMELLAAFLEDRLDSPGREEAERLLASSARAREVVASMVRFEQGTGNVGARPPNTGGERAADAPDGRIARRAWTRRWGVAVLPLAAAAAFTLLMMTSDETPAGSDPALLVAVGAPPPTAFAGWPVMRGGASDAAPIARLAARWLDTRALAASGQEAAARAELARLRSDAMSLPEGQELVLRLEAIRFDATGVAERPFEATDQTLRALDPGAYDLGTNLAALRLAAAGGLAEVADDLVASLVDRRDALEAAIGPGSATRLLDAVRPEGGTGLDLTATRSAVEAALSALGR